MISRIHQKLGTAGFIISIVALVAALAGGAYAASGGLSGKQKKEVTKIAQTEAKKFAGKNGAVGPAGPTGPIGVKGDKGDSGAAGVAGPTGAAGPAGEPGPKGSPGASGKSPTVVPLSPQNSGCKSSGGADLGGAKIIGVDGEESFVCNGEGGGVNQGGSMSGFWEVQGTLGLTQDFGAGPWALSTISYPVPLQTPPAEKLLVATPPSEAEEDKCPGDLTNPEAAAGVLCLYPAVPGLTLNMVIPTTFGAVLAFAETDKSFGSWAVTPAS